MKIPYQGLLILLIAYTAISRCHAEELRGDTSNVNCAGQDALAGCLTPKFSMDYYAEQGVKYFRTMQSDVALKVVPNYSDLVIRWEWPPWLLLTGYTKRGLLITDVFLKMTPTSYDKLDCRGFDIQPFCRCHVIFNYSGETVPIYEEFSFNDKGEITFIEAWSDYPSLLPMGPGKDSIWDEAEYWGMKEVKRLSTKIPGLGSATGLIDLKSDAIVKLAQQDTVVADMLHRMAHPVYTWMLQLWTHSKELKSGLNMPVGDKYPYYYP